MAFMEQEEDEEIRKERGKRKGEKEERKLDYEKENQEKACHRSLER